MVLAHTLAQILELSAQPQSRISPGLATLIDWQLFVCSHIILRPLPGVVGVALRYTRRRNKTFSHAERSFSTYLALHEEVTSTPYLCGSALISQNSTKQLRI